MKFLIDTSSLLSMERYYLQFDNDYVLYNFIKTKLNASEIIFIDKVLEESKAVAGGAILNKLDFLKSTTLKAKTVSLIPGKTFYQKMDKDFRNTFSMGLEEHEYEAHKAAFLKSGDARLILYALDQKSMGTDHTIICEETVTSNDKKTFKKIPAICTYLAIPVITLPAYLEVHSNLKIKISK